MNSSARDRLLDDVLPLPAFADSLHATRRAARHRRIRRRTVRAAAGGCLLVAAAWFCSRTAPEASPTAPVATTRPAPGFIAVATDPAHPGAVVHTVKVADNLVVSTRTAAGSPLAASEDDLFVLAGSRPAAIHRLADGSARWMWLDHLR